MVADEVAGVEDEGAGSVEADSELLASGLVLRERAPSPRRAKS